MSGGDALAWRLDNCTDGRCLERGAALLVEHPLNLQTVKLDVWQIADIFVPLTLSPRADLICNELVIGEPCCPSCGCEEG